MTRQQHTEGFKAGIGLAHILGIIATVAITVGIPVLAIIDLFN